MKTIITTIAILGAVFYAAWFGLNQQKTSLEEEIESLTKQGELRHAEERLRLRQRRDHEIRMMIPISGEMDAPFVRELADELYEEFGFNNAGLQEVLLRLRDLKIHQVKTLHHHLMERITFTDSPYQHLMLKAGLLILTEIDPLWLIQDIEGRREKTWQWSEVVASAFHSLLAKDPEAAHRYFSGISKEDLRSNKSPYSRMYTRMLAHYINHNPKAAMQLYLMQDLSIRNLPISGTWVSLPSMEMVKEYAVHLKDLSSDYSTASFAGLIASEAYRLGGVEGLADFSRLMAKPGADEYTQMQYMKSNHSLRLMMSREKAEELSDFLSSEAPLVRIDILTRLLYAWANRDLPRAFEWVESEPPGADRDRMLRALISVLHEVDPVAAEKWYPLISDSVLRKKHLEGKRKTEALYQN